MARSAWSIARALENGAQALNQIVKLPQDYDNKLQRVEVAAYLFGLARALTEEAQAAEANKEYHEANPEEDRD